MSHVAVSAENRRYTKCAIARPTWFSMIVGSITVHWDSRAVRNATLIVRVNVTGHKL